ncbi:MAG: hypothetical protein E7369_01610 [Clostridiales bacterium]|nr:hypothetical protein [Clostridiales bacterium]
MAKNERSYERLLNSIKKLSDDIKSKVNADDFNSLKLSKQYSDMLGFFKEISQKHSLDSYAFILLLTKLEEAFGEDALDIVQNILDNYVENNNLFSYKKEIGFCAFYYISIFYARNNEVVALKDHLEKYYKLFEDFTLLYELFGRFCETNKDYARQYYFSKIAVQKLKERYGADFPKHENPALYVSGVCGGVAIAEYCFLEGIIYKETNVDAEKPLEESPQKLIDSSLNKTNYGAGRYKYDNSFFDDGLFDKMHADIDRVIAFNPDYPKYYFLKAQVLFFNQLYENNMVSQEVVDEVQVLIDKAKSLVSEKNKNRRVLIERYDRFNYVVKSCPIDSDAWQKTQGFAYEVAKSKIVRSLDPKEVQPVVYDKKSNAPYAFVSYSSKDYKSVYCDLLEFKRAGIYCVYDNDMTVYNSKSDSEKQKWYIAVENKIRKSSCVICYLSANYLVSEPVLLELKLIEKYNKPVVTIDLDGDYRISSLIKRVSRDSVLSQKITSNTMQQFTKRFDDDNNVIARVKDPFIANHVNQVRERVYSLCPNVVNGLESEGDCLKNNGKGHPMEDAYYCDSVKNVFVVADGVTRQDPKEYETESDESISTLVAKTFCEVFSTELSKDLIGHEANAEMNKKFSTAFSKANESILKLNENYYKILPQKPLEAPGTCVLAGVVRNDTLYYAGLGDCVGVLIRNGKSIVFSTKQTDYAFKVARLERDRARLVKEYINNPHNPYGYGIANGDENANAYFSVSHIKLEYGDVVYLMTDGVADYITGVNPNVLKNKTTKQILSSVVKMYKNISGDDCSYDDMALIKIEWRNKTKRLIK